MEPERLLSGSSIICIRTLLMVPQLSVLSLALCHEALEGGGNHKTETSITKKKLMETIGWKPASQKETSPVKNHQHGSSYETIRWKPHT